MSLLVIDATENRVTRNGMCKCLQQQQQEQQQQLSNNQPLYQKQSRKPI